MRAKQKQRKLSNRVEKHIVQKTQRELIEAYKQRSLIAFF